jgi:integrase-like protein
MATTRPNQVWATDITYIAMARGFIYLAAVLDWFSRRVLAWRLFTMEAAFCLETLEDGGRVDRFRRKPLGFEAILQHIILRSATVPISRGNDHPSV